MPRTKVASRKKGNHSAENMLKALKLHRNGTSIRKAAKQLNIAYPTLRRYVANNLHVPITNLMNTRLTPNYENRSVFTAYQEQELKAYILECATKFYGLNVKNCCKIAYQMAKINNISMPNCWENKQMAGKEWFRSFKKRHPEISVKKPEACSLARATAFNRETVKTFFTNLKTVMERHPSFGNGCRIYNLDETATTTVQKPQKVVALKGKHNLSKVTSGEKGILVTTCAIVCASGQYIPPAMVFPRKNLKDIMLTGAPPGTLGLTHKSGWMTAELFVEVMKHFIKHTCASPENPALLIVDNHESHLSIEALDLAKTSGVTILTLHPHTTSKLQPLDVGLNGPFKVFYNNAVDSWMLRHPGSSMTIYNVAECVGVAYPRALTPVNISAAFKKCGIFPYNPDVFTDIDFLPSDVTDRPQPQIPALHSEVTGMPQAQESVLQPNFASNPQPRNQNPDLRTHDSDATDCEDIETISSPTVLDTFINPDESQFLDGLSNAPALSSSPTLPINSLDDAPTIPGCDFASSPTRVLTSEAKDFISPKQFMPPLKAPPRNMKQTRKRGKSRIATDTPEKNEMMEDRKKAQEKNNKAQQVIRSVLKEDGKTEKIPKTKYRKNTQNQRTKTLKPKNVTVEDVKKKRKIEKVVSSESSSEEEMEKVVLLSESEISEYSDTEDEDTFDIIRGNFQNLARNPEEGDFVLVVFETKKIKVYYVAKVIEISNANTYGVSYLRIKSKEQMKFVMPLEPDLAEVPIKDIKMILPFPKINGTKTRNTTYNFPVRVAPTINLR